MNRLRRFCRRLTRRLGWWLFTYAGGSAVAATAHQPAEYAVKVTVPTHWLNPAYTVGAVIPIDWLSPSRN